MRTRSELVAELNAVTAQIESAEKRENVDTPPSVALAIITKLVSYRTGLQFAIGEVPAKMFA